MRKPSKRVLKTESKSLFRVSCDPNRKIESIFLPEDFPEKVYTPREYQKPAVKWLWDRYSHDLPVSGLILSTGSGKSKASSIALSAILADNPKRKGVIAVPQEVIGESWRHGNKNEVANLLIREKDWEKAESLTDKERLEWRSFFKKEDIVSWSFGVDLCMSAGKACISENGKVKEFIKFLKSPATPSVHSRTILVTHATLALAYKELVKTKQLKLLSDLFLVIDEFHHLFVDSSEDNCNAIGELIYYILDNRGELNTRLCCLTATFFRGDRRRIFSGRFNELIQDAFYELPFDEYFRHMKYLEELIYDFGVFSAREGFVKPIANSIRKHGLSKSMFFIPSRTKGDSSAFPVSGKKNDVESVLRGILDGVGWKGKIEKRPYTSSEGIQNEAIFQLRVGEDKWITVVDAVDDEDRIRRGVKKFLRQVNNEEDSVDVIIALGMCKEGFDWAACDRIILLGNIKSLASIVQINGRMIRDVYGKKFAVMTWLLPTTTEIDTESITEDLNQALLSLHLALMMCIDIMQPIRIMAPRRNNPEEQEEISGADLLSELFETTDRRLEFLSMVSARIAREGHDVNFEERVGIVSDILLELGISEEDVSLYSDAVATYTQRRAAAVAANRNIRLSIDFDSPLVREMAKEFNLVNSEDFSPEGLLAAFAAEAIGVPSFKAFRAAVTRISTSFSEERWLEFQANLEAFVEANEREPDKDSEDPVEKNLPTRYFAG